MPLRIEPGAGQESVWDYPRPPRVERTQKHICITFNGATIADTRRALRVLETSHPPVYYIPPADIRMEYLQPVTGFSFCEWKGRARYYSVVAGSRRAERAAWSYQEPLKGYEVIAGYLAFYARLMDACYVDDEKARPQAGDFYGGWITDDLVGPFKGEPGTMGW